jgi:hypothetical protein
MDALHALKQVVRLFGLDSIKEFLASFKLVEQCIMPHYASACS